MERAKQPLLDTKTKDLFNHIFDNAMGNPIILDSVPTAADMKANTMAIQGNDLYIRFANGTCLKFAGAVVT